MSLQAIRQPNPTALAQARAKEVFNAIRRKFADRTIRSHDDVRQEIYAALADFFLHAGEPTYEGTELPAGLARTREAYSVPISQIEADLRVAYAETQALSQSTTASFNFQTALFDSLEGRIKKASSTLIDLQISNDRFNEPVIVAGDDFTDKSRIDVDATTALPRADVSAQGNVLTLRRTGNESVVDPSTVLIQVEPLKTYRYRLYEGQFYGLQNQWFPEGGAFHFEQSAVGQDTGAIPSDLLNRFRQYISGQNKAAGRDVTGQVSNILFQGRQNASQNGGKFSGFTKEEWELLDSNIHSGSDLVAAAGGEIRQHPQSLSSNQTIIDTGADLQTKLEFRRAMVDGDPSTFWQVEYVIDIGSQTASDTEIEELLSNMTEQDANDPERVGALTQLLQQSLRDFDVLDLDVRLTFDLRDRATLNWIDLNPLLFEGVEFMEVLRIATSDGGDTYEDIPFLRNGESAARISRDSNVTVSANDRDVIAPNASGFAGRGLWIFSPRAATHVQIDLRQAVPVLVPYHRQNLTLTRLVTRHRSRSAFKRKKRNTQSIESRNVRLSYPETVLSLAGSADPADLSKAAGATSTDRSIKYGTAAAALHIGAHGIGAAATVIAAGGGLFVGGRTSYGAESIAKSWLTTHWDKARYSIGIRDIGMWAFTYDTQSEMISTPFRSPQPIRDISLEVDETIPKEFNEGRERTSWIDYYISLGDDQDWYPIAPVNQRVTRTLEGNQIPVVIHVNSGIPPVERNPAEGYIDLDQEVDMVRFRAVLRRPTDITDADSFTPTLKSYRVLMTVRGGFR